MLAVAAASAAPVTVTLGQPVQWMVWSQRERPAAHHRRNVGLCANQRWKSAPMGACRPALGSKLRQSPTQSMSQGWNGHSNVSSAARLGTCT